MKYALRMTAAQHVQIRAHLFPGDGKEVVALLVCGRRAGEDRHIFTVRDFVPIPYPECDRSPVHVTWNTDCIDAILCAASREHSAIIKIHSHLAPVRHFSEQDDASDCTIFGSISSLLDDDLPHASLIMLADGEIIGRAILPNGDRCAIETVVIVGDEIKIHRTAGGWTTDEFMRRHAQAFGSGTTKILRLLSVAIIGCSGTGSIVAEQLARLGVGKLVLIDPDTVEEKNLNRIINTRKEDAVLQRYKVRVLAKAIARMGFGQQIVPLPINVCTSAGVRASAECDVVFGCMDGVEGRHLLNRLATFYCLPYIDVGVKLDADGKGGIENISGTVHYLQPGCSSLLSRRVYSMDQVSAEELRRTNPELYATQRREGYIRGVPEDRPAVISVNMFFASLAVNELLARLHPYRNEPNGAYAVLSASLTELRFYTEAEQTICDLLGPHVARGDVTPLLERPALS